MIGLKVNGEFLDLDEGTKVRLQMNSPVIDRKIFPGEYSFPFRIPATARNLRLTGYRHLPESAGKPDQVVEAVLYVHNVVFNKGFLQTNYSGSPFIDINFIINSSKFSLIKDVSIRDLEFDGVKDISATKQSIEYNFYNDYIGSVIQMVFDGVTVFIQPVSTTVNAALLLLKAQIDAYSASPGFYDGRTLTVSVSGNNITIETDWFGVNPEMAVHINTFPGTTVDIVNQVDIFDVYESDWRAHMQDHVDNVYPDRLSAFAPVKVTNGKKPWADADDTSTYGFMTDFFQNMYDTTSSIFMPRVEVYHPTVITFVGNAAGVTPFAYVTAILDEIGKRIGTTMSGFLHSSGSLFILYSNYIVDMLVNETYSNVTLTTKYELGKTLPDVTIENFLLRVCENFGLALLPKKKGTEFELVFLKDILYASDVIDWTNKVPRDVKIYAESVATGLLFDYDRTDTDDFVKVASEQVEKWIYIGAYQTVTDLPDNVAGNINMDSYIYAFVIDTGAIYLRTLPVGTFNWVWTLVGDKNAKFVIGDEQAAKEVKFCDPIKTEIVPQVFYTAADWKVPHVDMPLSQIPYDRHLSTIKNIRFLMYHGLHLDDSGKTYPFASSDGIDTPGTNFFPLNLYGHGPEGLYQLVYKEWANFLINAKKVELPVKLNIIDVLALDWGKRIFIDGSYYLLQEIRVEFPITKEATVVLIKIE